MRIMGIDPGYAIVGCGVIDRQGISYRLVDYGAIETPAGLQIEERLEMIYDQLTFAIRKYRPDAMAIEQLFFTSNQKTIIAVGEARGVILLCARQLQVPIFEYTPLQVKMSVVGYGRAEKRQVMDMTRRLLKLEAIPKPDDAADALAIAICHGNTSASSLARFENLR